MLRFHGHVHSVSPQISDHRRGWSPHVLLRARASQQLKKGYPWGLVPSSLIQQPKLALESPRGGSVTSNISATFRAALSTPSHMLLSRSRISPCQITHRYNCIFGRCFKVLTRGCVSWHLAWQPPTRGACPMGYWHFSIRS